MTNSQQTAAIGRAIALQQEIAALQEQLELLKEQFRKEAVLELAKEGIRDLPGFSWNFISEEGPVARVNFPAPALVRQIIFIKDVAHKWGEDKKLVPMGKGDLRELCGVGFSKLFASYYKPAKAFRELLGALLSAANAKKVLELCLEPPGTPRVSFEVKAS